MLGYSAHVTRIEDGTTVAHWESYVGFYEFLRGSEDVIPIKMRGGYPDSFEVSRKWLEAVLKKPDLVDPTWLYRGKGISVRSDLKELDDDWFNMEVWDQS